MIISKKLSPHFLGHFHLSDEYLGLPSENVRKCLQCLLENNDETSIENHHHVTGSEHLLVCLSHSERVSIAYLVDRNNELGVSSIGVDLESKHRIISKKVQKYFINELDSYGDILGLWCKKEAVFKAVNPLFPRCRQLLDIVIQSDDKFYIRNNEKLTGVVYQTEVEGHVLTFATLSC